MDGNVFTSKVLRKRKAIGTQALTWPFAVALGAMWILTYAAGIGWFAQGSVRQQRDAAVARVESLTNQLGSSIEPLLASGELSAVRRLISEAGYQEALTTCRLELSDGRSLADADLDKPQMTVLPVDFPTSTATQAQTRVINGQIMIDQPVPLPGNGEAVLTIVAQMPPITNTYSAMLPGVALVGMLGLAGLMLIYRKMQSRLEVLSLIRGALRDAGQGTPDLSALAVNPIWGPEAAGWNRLIATRQIGEQTQIEQQLDMLNTQSSGGVLESACDGLWTGLLLADSRGRVVYLNGAAAASLLMDRDVAPGMPLTPMIADPKLAEHVEQILSGSGAGRLTHELKLGYGSETSTLRVTLRRLTETGGMVMTLEDITQQRVSESSRHDFVSRATHELRTPLTNIRLYVETAQEDGENDKELRGQCLNVIARESQRLERLVSEMLSVSEIEAGSMTIRRDDVRLDQLFKSLEMDYGANAKSKDIDLHFDLPPKLPAIQGDRDKLAIVLQNLLGNAIKYTPNGGKVNVSVDLSATELNVEVRDTGIGISEEDQKHVFEKFYRANDPRLGDITGSGLGLALAFEIVRLHGGAITVDSVLNEGSSFRLVLPISAEGV